MCRIGALKSKDPLKPAEALKLMLPQQEGHDNSGFALVMQDLEGVFSHYKDKPLLSLACTRKGLQMVNDYMEEKGFVQLAQWVPETHASPGMKLEAMPYYVFRNYDYPEIFRYRTEKDREDLLMDTRLALRKILDEAGEGFVYSFWPDVLTLKEIGDPADIANYFGLWDENSRISARNIVAQCRQNTNYGIARYAAHPFFFQGYTLCANGENTLYSRNTEFQKSLYRGYQGFESDSQNLLYSLHYVLRQLEWPLPYYKHVITPLPAEEVAKRPECRTLGIIRDSLSQLEINGPNAAIGLLPDGRMLAVCDAKKLRPLVIGGNEDMMAITSEVCGLNSIMPHRNIERDVYLNERETLVINNDLETQRWYQ